MTSSIGQVAEYEALSRLEQETTRLRYATFTALMSVSFVLPGLAFTSRAAGSIVLFGRQESIAGLAMLLGFLFYVFTVAHYLWYHNYAHKYRSRLKVLEDALGIRVYRLRVRPRLLKMKFHFDWILYILGLTYLYITGEFVGWWLTGSVIVVDVAIYALLLVWSIWWKDEPLE